MTDYTTEQLSHMRSILQTPGWKLLEAEFAHIKFGVIDKVMRSDTDDDARIEEIVRQEGRDEVIGWFAGRLEEAGWVLTNEEGEDV
jgi:hypothetical protein